MPQRVLVGPNIMGETHTHTAGLMKTETRGLCVVGPNIKTLVTQ